MSPASPFLLLLLLSCWSLSSIPAVVSSIPDSWVLYTPGNCPVVISVPHGGSLKVTDIAERTNGCDSGDVCSWVKGCSPASSNCKAGIYKDSYTDQIAATVVSELSISHNCIPHYVRANLHRSRVDLNREIHEAAQGDPLAESAWHRYHTQFMAQAVANISDTFGKGLVIDIHGQTHAEQWTEIGMLLSRNKLNNIDDENVSDALMSSSIRAASERANIYNDSIIRGPKSLGGLLSAKGYKVVPSPAYPSPGSGNYFSGGFTVKTYGSRNGGNVDAMQVEVNKDIRMSSSARGPYAKALAGAIHEFLVEFGYLTG